MAKSKISANSDHFNELPMNTYDSDDSNEIQNNENVEPNNDSICND
jgi:hypothetical protein